MILFRKTIMIVGKCIISSAAENRTPLTTLKISFFNNTNLNYVT